METNIRETARKLGLPEDIDIPDLDKKFKGAHHRKDYQIKYYPDFYNWIVKRYPDIKTHAERMYLFSNGMEEPPHCPECGKYAVFNSNHRYSTYCSRVCGLRSEKTRELARTKKMNRTQEEKEETLRKRRKTNLERYGTENPMELDAIKEKQRRTTFERYGVEFSLQSEDVRESGTMKLIERYGVDNPMKSKEIREISSNTTLERYGVDNVSKSDVIKERKRNTLMKHYGVSEIMQSEELRKRHTESIRNHYGVDNPFQSEEIKSKIKSNNQRLYGCYWNCQRIENRRESEPNRHFREILEKLGIDYEQEFPIGKYIYDFRVGNILFEISPSVTHNVDFNPFGCSPISIGYHQEKCLFAKDNGYTMVEIWDWDNPEDVVLKSLDYKCEHIDASDFDVRFVSPSEGANFISVVCGYGSGSNDDADQYMVDILNTALCSDHSFCVGLYKDDILYSTLVAIPEGYMTIQSYDTIPGVKITGGLRKMVEYLLDNSDVEWCNSSNITLDLSKCKWKEFFDNGFKISEIYNPDFNLYSLKTHKLITSNNYYCDIERIRGSVIDGLVNRTIDEYCANEKISSDDLDDEIDKMWMCMKSDISGLDSTQVEIHKRIREFNESLYMERFVKVYDCGKARLVWTKS